MFDKTDIIGWTEWADRAYVSARMLWFTGLILESPVQAHRTLELYLKAFLSSNGAIIKKGMPSWGHSLWKLCSYAAQYDQGFERSEVSRRITFFDRYFEYMRYPNRKISPPDGSLIWFSFDSNIQPLDELVAFIRPRIIMLEEEWKESMLYRTMREANNNFLKRALIEHNNHIHQIICESSEKADVLFASDFHFDLPGC